MSGMIFKLYRPNFLKLILVFLDFVGKFLSLICVQSLGKTVEKASIKGKRDKFNNFSTKDCGLTPKPFQMKSFFNEKGEITFHFPVDLIFLILHSNFTRDE
jgi:hypothetical protein